MFVVHFFLLCAAAGLILLRRAESQDTDICYDINACLARALADGHTVSNASDLFRPPKLSGTGPG